MFVDIYQEKTLFAAPEYAVLIMVTLAVSVLVALPLLFGIFTKFKKNPYRVLYRSLASVLTAFASGNIIPTVPMNESIARTSWNSAIIDEIA